MSDYEEEMEDIREKLQAKKKVDGKVSNERIMIAWTFSCFESSNQHEALGADVILCFAVHSSLGSDSFLQSLKASDRTSHRSFIRDSRLRLWSFTMN